MNTDTLQVMENYLSYSSWSYQLVGHVLTLGMAAMLAGLVYFLATSRQVSPRYRLSSYLSAVVMASAFVELGLQYAIWSDSFVRDPLTGRFSLATGAIFANGYRYANWSIDVPVLLTQLLVVLGITGARFWKNWSQFVVAGLLMIWTGYIGQYYQAVPTAAGGFMQTAPYWIWFFVSWVFFLWILAVVYRVVRRHTPELPDKAQPLMKGIAVLLLASWTLYPVAYLCPWISFSEGGVVGRQILYTVADVTSKVVYGVLLGQVALMRSADEGYAEAVAQRQRGASALPPAAEPTPAE